MAKRILAVIMCLVVLFSAFTVPVKAFALTAGTGAALAVLITGLLASGVTIAASSVDLEPAAQAIYNTMDTQMQQLITGVKLAELGGKVFANWTATQWNTFTNWVTTHFYATGETGIYITNTGVLLDWSDVGVKALTLDSSGYTNFVASGYNGNILVSVDGTVHSNVYIGEYLKLSFGYNSSLPFSSLPSFFYSTDLAYSRSSDDVVIGLGYYSPGGVFSYTPTVTYCGRTFVFFQVGNRILARSGLTDSYVYDGTLRSFWTEIIGAGQMVGDFGAWPDVINPADKPLGKPVSIDVNDDEYVGTGIDGLPRTLNPGQSIDVPLGDVVPGSISIDDSGTVSVPIPDVYPDVTPKDVINDVTITDVTDTDIPDVDDLPDNPDDPENTKEKANKMKFPAVAVQKFPFCIPWDFVNAVKMMAAPAAVPEFSIPVNIPSLNYQQTIDISLDSVSTLATVCRWFILAGFILALILATKSIIK